MVQGDLSPSSFFFKVESRAKTHLDVALLIEDIAIYGRPSEKKYVTSMEEKAKRGEMGEVRVGVRERESRIDSAWHANVVRMNLTV
jgi:hypothetical protein